MKEDIYSKYFEKRNKSLKDLDQDNNSRRVFETFNSALEYFNHNVINKNDNLLDIGCGDRSFINFFKKDWN